MVSSSHETRPISWNGIHFFLPARWALIVKGTCHLIIEENHHPILEVRWQNNPLPAAGRSHTDIILSRLRKEMANEPLLIESPPFLLPLTSRFMVSTFALEDPSRPEGAIITCRKNDIPILLQFFNPEAGPITLMTSFFKTFTVSFEEDKPGHWAIDDLKLDIPRIYTLEASSFSLGLIQLFFKNKTTELKFCRIAHATRHFQNNTFRELFGNFCGDTGNSGAFIDERTLILDAQPSLGDQLLRVVKRKQIYRWAKFHHLVDQDKILGMHVQSLRPLDKKQLARIDTSYATI